MPLFSEHISNMYYSGTPSYTSVPYSYSSSPYGTSYSASYLNPGGNYSNHSSLVPYTRTLSSRWLGRNYSPILSTISEKGTTSPVRINSPRRTPVTRTYTSHVSIPTSYTSRPITINTADIDVSRDKYRSKVNSTQYFNTEFRRNSPVSQNNKEVSSHSVEKPNTGVDPLSRTQPERSTIKRDRPVVRLHTVKRKDRDSPRQTTRSPSENSEKNKNVTEEKDNKPELLKWRERLAEDLAYKNKKEKKTIGEKLVEKFTLKDYRDCDVEKSSPESIRNSKELSIEVLTPNVISIDNNKSPGRRCSMEHLAEEASLLDSMIRRENLSTATLDVSKIEHEHKNNNHHEKKNFFIDQASPLTTTKSDYSVFPQQAIKRKSLRKSTSGENIRILDSISEIAQSVNNKKLITKEKNTPIKNKLLSQATQKLKPKITSSVEVSSPPNPLKVVVENVTIEEKPLNKKKDIVYSSVIEDIKEVVKPPKAPTNVATGHRKSVKIKMKPKEQISDVASPEPEDGNFWRKIGKRETVYLIQRKKELEKASEHHKRTEFWFPEEEEEENDLKQNCNNDDLHKLRGINNEPVTDDTNCKSTVLKSNASDILPKEIKQVSYGKSLIGTNDVLNLNKTQEQAHIVNERENMEELSSTQETHLSGSLSIKETKMIKMKKSDDFGIQEQYRKPNNVSSESISNNEVIELETSKIDKETSSEHQNKSVIKKEKKITGNIDESSPRMKSSDELKKENLEPSKISNNKDVQVLSQQGEEIASKDSEELNILKAFNNVESKTEKNEFQLNNDSINNEGISSISSDSKHHGGYEKSLSEFENNKSNDDQTSALRTESQLKLIDDVFKQNLNVTENNKEYKLLMNATNESQNKKDEDILPEIIEKKISASIKTENEKEPEDQLNKVNTEKPIQNAGNNLLFTNRKPVKDIPAPRPLIATPRPLQKKAPRVIHSSSSSETSSSEESSEEDESSESSADFYECENNLDGRTSTGSNDSGFDSSAPTSPSGFSYVRKGADHPSTSSGSVPAQTNNYDIIQHELEQSTAYGLFKKTGRFTPPARSIPRFRKYTIDDFQFIKVLGKGSFGKVMLAELRDTEYYYAVKCLKKDVVLEDDDVECTLIERKVLALGTNHPYLCHLFATFQTDSHLFFVMEYLNGGDLMFHIQQSGRFPEPRARFYAAEIVSGLKFLHKRGIVYRDLKLDNILLDFDGHVRIADFGMCKLQIYLDKTADTFCGTPDYMAPEIIKGVKYNQTVDWWSFGVLLYEMLIGQSPFSGCDEDELFWSICNEMPSYPRFLSSESLSILTRLLDKDARTRLGGVECMHGDVLDQAFFHDIHWDKLERRELEAPFKPRVRHPLDTQYFDRAFTGERPRLTAVEPQVLRSMDQEPFRGFSYTNPNATDR